MRADMAQVVIERPRYGSDMGYPRAHAASANISFEDLPSFEPIGKIAGKDYRSKSQTDLLGPLYKYLRSQVGRRWDDVYSDICANLNRDSTIHDHIFSHLYQRVLVKTFVGADGFVWSADDGFVARVLSGMYVDPISGVLCVVGARGDEWTHYRWYHHRRRGVAPAAPDWKKLDDGRELRRVNGIWYWVVFADVPPPEVVRKLDAAGNVTTYTIDSRCVDIFTKESVKYPGKYRCGKVQMNRKDLRAHGVSNENSMG